MESTGGWWRALSCGAAGLTTDSSHHPGERCGSGTALTLNICGSISITKWSGLSDGTDGRHRKGQSKMVKAIYYTFYL